MQCFSHKGIEDFQTWGTEVSRDLMFLHTKRKKTTGGDSKTFFCCDLQQDTKLEDISQAQHLLKTYLASDYYYYYYYYSNYFFI